jgi:hypothetical protein
MVPKIIIKQVNQSAERLTLSEDFPAECRECGARAGGSIKSGAELEIIEEFGDLILVVNCRNCGKKTGKPRRSTSLVVPL